MTLTKGQILYRRYKKTFELYRLNHGVKVGTRKKTGIRTGINKPSGGAEYEKEYYKKNRDSVISSVKKWRINNKEKYLAHNTITPMLTNGSLVKQPCEVCGNPKSEAHHDDYSKPLEVRWLCRKHHREFHKLLIIDKK